MEKTYRYKPENVCSKEMILTLDGEKIIHLETVRGCPGNTQGVNRLAEGRNAREVITLLSGIKCPGSRTHMDSCPNQLARALSLILEGKLEPEE